MTRAVNDTTREVAFDEGYRQGAADAARWLQHIDRLLEVPGAPDLLPHKNPLWDAAELMREHFGVER